MRELKNSMASINNANYNYILMRLLWHRHIIYLS